MNDPDQIPPVPPPARFNWLLFLAVLLSPVVLTVLVVLAGAKSGDPAPTTAVVGGGTAGIICGIMLGRRIGKAPETKILLSLVFAAILIVVCIGMSCCGCLASDYRLNFH